MNAREVIAQAIEAYFSDTLSGDGIADVVLERMDAAGFTIMSKEDVERIERAILGDREGKVSAATVLHMIKDAMQR